MINHQTMSDDEILESLHEDEIAILPAWFVPRMMSDNWSFGLLLTGGLVLGIATIDHVRRAANGTIWLDVEMMTAAEANGNFWAKNLPMPVIGAPTERTRASINAAHVVWAFELADT